MVSNEMRRIAAPAFLTLPVLLAVAACYDPLLGSSRGGSFVWDFCEAKPDATPLPPDPRTLVQPRGQPGQGGSLQHLVEELPRRSRGGPRGRGGRDCGELRERFYRGELLLDTGSPAVGGLFTGTDPDSVARPWW